MNPIKSSSYRPERLAFDRGGALAAVILLMATAVVGPVSKADAEPVAIAPSYVPQSAAIAPSYQGSYQWGMIRKGPAPSTEGVTCSTKMVPMRDGTKLSTEITRPAMPGKYPVIMMRTPYYSAVGVSGCVNHPYWPLYGPGSRSEIAASGYITITQEVRGTSRSEGEFRPIINEAKDGYDAVEWAASQPWSTGKVGMYQGSYHGMVQWQAAIAQPPHLTTIVPMIAPISPNDDWPLGQAGTLTGLSRSWAGGQSIDQLRRRLLAEGASPERTATEVAARKKQLAVNLYEPPAEALPLAGDPVLNNDLIPFYREWLEHPGSDYYWKDTLVAPKFPTLSLPVLSYGAWYDLFIHGTVDGHIGMQDHAATPEARASARLVIGGAGHALIQSTMANLLRRPIDESLGNYVGDITFGRENQIPQDLAIQWYDHWLKGIDNGVMDDPAVRLFVMVPPDQGSVGTGFWISDSKYPLPETQTIRYYLSGGPANSLAADGTLSLTPAEGSDQFQYDPANPAPSIGGAHIPGGPSDQRVAERRSDVLVYTSEPLTKALPVIGDLTVTLKASSTAPSTAFTAKLVDVHLDDYAQIISDGIIVTPAAAPNSVGTYTIRMTPTATLFKPGHRIRLEISSSNYPHYMVHTNTTDPIATAKDLVVATQTVRWQGTSLNLPVPPIEIPASALDPAHPANSLQSAIAAALPASQP